MKTIWNAWKKIAIRIGDFQTSVIFSLLYFVLVTPIGLVFSLSRKISAPKFPEWQKVEDNVSSLDKLKLQ